MIILTRETQDKKAVPAYHIYLFKGYLGFESLSVSLPPSKAEPKQTLPSSGGCPGQEEGRWDGAAAAVPAVSVTTGSVLSSSLLAALRLQHSTASSNASITLLLTVACSIFCLCLG